MIDHVWTVLCSRAVIDKKRNNISLESVIEKVTVRGHPQPNATLPIDFDIATLSTRRLPNKPCQGHLRVECILPSGEKFGELTSSVRLETNLNHRAIMHLSGLPFVEAGRYLFVVFLQQPNSEEWEQVTAIPLQLGILPPEDGGLS